MPDVNVLDRRTRHERIRRLKPSAGNDEAMQRWLAKCRACLCLMAQGRIRHWRRTGLLVQQFDGAVLEFTHGSTDSMSLAGIVTLPAILCEK